MVVKLLTKNPHSSFSFFSAELPSGNKCARLHLKRKDLCLFFTITDLENRVVAALSLGQVALSKNRRVKCSVVSVDRLILKMYQILKAHSIKSVILLFRSSFSWQLKNLERSLALYGMEVIAIEDRQRTPHGTLRLPKQPRK